MEQELTFKKTRLAPTPSGFLHLGNIFSFAITAAMAKRTNAKIVLRIDDFDLERTNKLYVQDIFDTLNFLEIPWDEGPRNLQEYESEYSQLHRMDIYRSALQQLKEAGKIFACTCSRAQVHANPANYGYLGTCRNKNISLEAANTCWRLFTDDATGLDIKTFPGTVVKTRLPADMKDFIVRRKDGIPAYQLISILDDVHFGIDLVVRGEDLWSSTLAQHYLSLLLGQDTCQDVTFYHHPLLIGQDGSKLSKSEGATSVYYLRKQNKKPAYIYSAIAKIRDVAKDWQSLAAMMNETIMNSK